MKDNDLIAQLFADLGAYANADLPEDAKDALARKIVDEFLVYLVSKDG